MHPHMLMTPLVFPKFQKFHSFWLNCGTFILENFRAGGRDKPGVAGAASEHPLEGVVENAARRLQRGGDFPLL